jgi:hypothetical protein
MTPEAILRDLLERGIEPCVTPDGRGISVPAGRLTEGQRKAIRANKHALIEYLTESSRLTSQLLSAAMYRCDQFNDSDSARAQMRHEVLATPEHLRRDLLDYFKNQCKELK